MPQKNVINPVMAHAPILYLLKTPENQRWYKIGTFLGGTKWKHWPEMI